MKISAEWLDAMIGSLEDHKDIGFDEGLERQLAAFTELQQLREQHADLARWVKAYPLEVFPEPDMKVVHTALQRDGMTLDAVSASIIRRVLRDVAERLDLPEEADKCQ